MALTFYMLPGLLLAAALVPLSSVAAQSRAGDDPGFAASGLTSVPAIDGRGWILRARVRSRYDTNILRLGTLQTVNAGRFQRADFQATPTVEGAFALPVGRQQLFVGGEFGRDFFARNTMLGRNRYRMGGGVNLRAGSRCTGALGAEFSSRQVQLSVIAGLSGGIQESVNYGAEANCQAGVGLGFGGSVRRSQFRNTEPTRQLFDFDSIVFAPQISYALPVLGTFSVGGSYNRTQFTTRQVILADGLSVGDGVDILSGRVGFSRELGSRLTIIVGASYLETLPTPGAILGFPGPGLPPTVVERESFSGIGYDASIVYRAGARLTTTVHAGRNVRASPNVGAQFVLSERYGLDLNYRLGRAIAVASGVTHDFNKFGGSFISADEPLRRLSDRISRVYGSVSYTPVALYGVSLEVAQQNRKSDPDLFSFKSTSVLLSLNVNLGSRS